MRKNNMIKSIRIYPLSEKEFFDNCDAKCYFRYGLKEQNGKFYYRNKPIVADTGTLILFQYCNNIIAQAELLRVCKYESPLIENSVEYNGHFLFNLDTIRYYREPLSQEEFYTIYPEKRLSRATHKLDNQAKNNRLIKLIDSRI